MDIHFNDTRPAGASAATLFDVITDYPRYPDFNPALIHVTVIRQDDTGAEFVADRKTRIGKRVRAYGR
jgi:ribosome-associated toxin RatA of RatAB toxin-antitoxin module